METILYIHVALTVRPYTTLLYAVPSVFNSIIHKKIGARVVVPLGVSNRAVVGIIVGITVEKTIEQQIKPFLWILDREPLFSSEYQVMIVDMGNRYALEQGLIYAQVLPEPLLRTKGKLQYVLNGVLHKCSYAELYMQEAVAKAILYEQWCSGLLEIQQEQDNTLNTYTVTQPPPWNIRTSAKKQQAILQFLWDNGATEHTTLQENFGIGCMKIMHELMQKGLIHISFAMHNQINILHTIGRASESIPEALAKEASTDVSAIECASGLNTEKSNASAGMITQQVPILTQEQKQAVDTLHIALQKKTMTTYLLHGVTGSGKSRVYTECIAYTLQQGRSAIVLVPEVALIQRIVSFCESVLQEGTYCIYHGYQNASIKAKVMQYVSHCDKPMFIIGTRSALFLPIRNVGLIILDEEHDASYKQDARSLIYSAKELAWQRMQQEKGVLLLGSATPDVKTYYASEQHAIERITLNQRATGRNLPTIELVDMQAYPQELFAPTTLQALAHTYEQKQQSIILLNRRGYALHVYCTLCGSVQRCPNCDISLMYHKKQAILRCPYCEYKRNVPSTCSICKGMDFLPLGCGTEKLEEILYNILPKGARILRLDKDTGSDIATIERTLQSFGAGEADILVGTQMLAKGHDFPNVSLCVISDADIGLHFPDYRATERTFQLLVQTAGRAGRSWHDGHVLIQTRYPQHSCWKYVQENNYYGFYKEELAVRKKWCYPPYTNMALIRFRFPKGDAKCTAIMQSLRGIIQQQAKKEELIVLGPHTAPRGLVNNMARYQCIVKGKNWTSIRKLYAFIEYKIRGVQSLQSFLDLDPIAML